MLLQGGLGLLNTVDLTIKSFDFLAQSSLLFSARLLATSASSVVSSHLSKSSLGSSQLCLEVGNLTIEISCFARGSLVLCVEVLLETGHGLILAGQFFFKVDDSLAQNLVFVLRGIELRIGGIELSLKFSVLFFDLVNFNIAGVEFNLELGAGSIVLLCSGQLALQASDRSSIGIKFTILSLDLL